MAKRILPALLLLLLFFCSDGLADNSGNSAVQAEQGFREILELWRAENYERLYMHLEPSAGKGWPYFAERIVHGSRVPACCWEMLQDVKVSVIAADHVLLHARVGLEVEGVGTRFVERDFPLRRIGGVWKMPMQLVLDLSEYNMQRVPRSIYERPLQ